MVLIVIWGSMEISPALMVSRPEVVIAKNGRVEKGICSSSHFA
jgi:hypothetical protein